MKKNDNIRRVQKIRDRYIVKNKEYTEFDALVELDKTVKRPVDIFAYIFGTIGSLIMGTGMSFAMGVIGRGLEREGIMIGMIGVFMVCMNYGIYKYVLEMRKEKYAPEIIRLSNKILEEEQDLLMRNS
ncbi:MAG: dihydropteridine reductase [Oscillospiraceae bacterium]|nr:dihydropteridine reductase [Oscillospiraceae bacterium]